MATEIRPRVRVSSWSVRDLESPKVCKVARRRNSLPLSGSPLPRGQRQRLAEQLTGAGERVVVAIISHRFLVEADVRAVMSLAGSAHFAESTVLAITRVRANSSTSPALAANGLSWPLSKRPWAVRLCIRGPRQPADRGVGQSGSRRNTGLVAGRSSSTASATFRAKMDNAGVRSSAPEASKPSTSAA